MSEQTYWNGEPTPCRRVVVRVPKAEKATYWYAELEGQERRAVEVQYGDQTYILDDEDGGGWAKVTEGHGSPRWGHLQFMSDIEILREVEP